MLRLVWSVDRIASASADSRRAIVCSGFLFVCFSEFDVKMGQDGLFPEIPAGIQTGIQAGLKKCPENRPRWKHRDRIGAQAIDTGNHEYR